MFSSDIIRRSLIERSVGNNMENDEKDVLAVKGGSLLVQVWAVVF